MSLIISTRTREKLQSRHGVSTLEIEQCFRNRDGNFFEDTREEHLTDPATLWFLAETDRGRLLKVCFMLKDREIYIKTAYEPSDAVIQLYAILSKE